MSEPAEWIYEGRSRIKFRLEGVGGLSTLEQEELQIQSRKRLAAPFRTKYIERRSKLWDWFLVD